MLVVESDYLPDSEVFFSAMFIPHEDFTPHNYVHSSTWGSVEGGTPFSRSVGALPLAGGFGGEALEGKIAF